MNEALRHDIMANWPFVAVEITERGSTFIHRSPTDPSVFALMRVRNERWLGVSYVEVRELHAVLRALEPA